VNEADFLPGLEEALHKARTGKGKKGEGRKTRACTLCIIIEHTRPGVAKGRLIECANGRISGRALQRALRTVGVTVERAVIQSHRNEAHQ
jgi:hypothetical protein